MKVQSFENAPSRADVSDEIRVELHNLNNALAAALGRVEICDDALEKAPTVDVDVLRPCLVASQRAILRARDHASQIAALVLATFVDTSVIPLPVRQPEFPTAS